MFIFNGVTKTITIDSTDINVVFNIATLFEEYNSWVDKGLYPVALLQFGAVPIDNTQYIEGYMFLQNNVGWRIVPPTINGVTVTINGSLYAQDNTLPIFNVISGQTTSFIVNRASMVISNTIIPEVNITKVAGQDITNINDFKNDIDDIVYRVWTTELPLSLGQYPLNTLYPSVILFPQV